METQAILDLLADPSAEGRILAQYWEETGFLPPVSGRPGRGPMRRRRAKLLSPSSRLRAGRLLLEAYKWLDWRAWCALGGRASRLRPTLPRGGQESMCFFLSAADALWTPPLQYLMEFPWASKDRDLSFLWALIFRADFPDLYRGVYPMNLDPEGGQTRPHFTLFACLYLLRKWWDLGPFLYKRYNMKGLYSLWEGRGRRDTFERTFLRSLLKLEWSCLALDLSGVSFDPEEVPFLMGEGVEAVCVGVGGRDGHAYTLRRTGSGWELVDRDPSFPRRESVQYLCMWRRGGDENRPVN